MQFEIKTSLKDQGVGSDYFDPRTLCEEHLSININNLRDSTHNVENHITAAGKYVDRNIDLIIKNLHNPHLICDVIILLR